MKIVTVYNQKGGVGKTLAASLLGAGFARRGLRVGLADLDGPQYSLARWHARQSARADAPEALWMVPAADAAEALSPRGRRRWGGDLDLLVVDTPPNVLAEPERALGASDLALLVVEPSWVAFEATAGALELAARARRANRGLALRALVNLATPSAETSQLAEGLRAQGLEVLDATLRHLVEFPRAFASGTIPTPQPPPPGPAPRYGRAPRRGAGADLHQLLDELEDVLWPSQTRS